jgi:SpoVK/Ycf46/Vps4 family AAA+-type ATPase
MEYFSIIRSMVRIALAQGDETLVHQTERLAAALTKAGDPDGRAIERLLKSAGETRALAPSRLTKSPARSGGTNPERMREGVATPVDRETAAPLASIIFPEDNEAVLPVLEPEVMATVSSLLVEWEHHEKISNAGLNASLTCLIYGAPGTGKTTLALWLAKQLGLPAVVARLDGLISSYLGTTARNMGALFSFANRYDCVLVLDEFDAIAKLRDDPNEVGEIKRVVNTLLQNMDERHRRGVTFGLTNHPALLDPAVWRRFDIQLEIPLPEPAQRVVIAARVLGDEGPDELVDAKMLAWFSGGMSGAELVTLTEKYRKRLIIGSNDHDSPAALVRQLARTTSNRGVARPDALANDAALTRALFESADIKFSQSEVARVLGVSTKTVGRRLADVSETE